MSTNSDAHLARARALLDAGRPAVAQAELTRILHTTPRPSASLCDLLAKAALHMNRLAEAGHWYRRAAQLGGSPWHALSAAALVDPVQPSEEVAALEWARIQRELAQLEARSPGAQRDPPPQSLLISQFAWAYLGVPVREEIERLHRLITSMWPAFDFVAPHCAPDAVRSPGKPRAAIFWAFGANHPVEQWCSWMFDALLAAGAEVTLLAAAAGAQGAQRPWVDRRVPVVPLPRVLEQARERVAELELDLLIYPEIGMNRMSYAMGMARLARVQCVSTGHPVTTGFKHMDYFLSSACVEQPDAQAHYRERLVALEGLPGPWTWREPPPILSDERAEFGLPPGNLYALCHNPIKLHPSYDRVLARILDADPDARLMLWSARGGRFDPATAARLQRSLGHRADRVWWHSRYEGETFVRYLRNVAVVLDPPHFGIGTTLPNTLRAGTPVITRPGAHYRNRLAAGLYRALGVEDTVVRTEDEYVALAVELATNPDARRRVSERIVAAAKAASGDRTLTESFISFAHTCFEEAGCPTSA